MTVAHQTKRNSAPMFVGQHSRSSIRTLATLNNFHRVVSCVDRSASIGLDFEINSL